MARGKFNKRGGGPRLDAMNAEEIEIRNARIAELEEVRMQRRADAEEDGEEKVEKAEGTAEEVTGKVDAEPEEKTDKKSSKKGIEDKPATPVTTEADHRRNMAKLADVRKRREEADARRKMEEEAANLQEEERKKMVALTIDKDHDESPKKGKKTAIPKLDKMAIKKMKPAQMKEALKLRNLDIQGNAKELQERLMKYEAER